jgi:hypothetical protein
MMGIGRILAWRRARCTMKRSKRGSKTSIRERDGKERDGLTEFKKKGQPVLATVVKIRAPLVNQDVGGFQLPK